MADSEYIIEMKHITKHFPGIVANDDVSLSIKKGEIYALCGHPLPADILCEKQQGSPSSGRDL